MLTIPPSVTDAVPPIVKLESAEVEPTFPLKETLPVPVAVLKEKAPSTVEPKLTLLLLVLSVVLAPKITAPV